MPDPVAIPQTPPDVAAFLAKARIPRARAVKKLEDVVRRLCSGDPALRRVREVWVFGSFARGASMVGDVDLYMLADEPRDRGRFGLDLVFGRERPFSKEIKALGCSGSSIVSVQAHPVFDEPAEPGSPERLAAETAVPAAGRLVPEVPVVRHLVTNEPLAGPFILLWARGDQPAWALQRLHEIPEHADAARHERTTSVPLLDDLTPKLGLEIAFMLAAQIRSGNVRCRALLLEPADAPIATREALAERYFSPTRARPSARVMAAAAALAQLEREGVDLGVVRLVGVPVCTRHSQARVFVEFNAFELYRAASGGYDTGDRVLQVWPTPRGPWLALALLVVNAERVRELYGWLTAIDAGPEVRTDRILAVLTRDT